MTKIKKQIIKNYRILNRILYFIIACCSLLLYPLLLTNINKYNSTETFIDKYIPFWPVFVIPYISYLALLAFTLLYFIFFRKNYQEQIIIFAIIQVLASIVYFFYQTRMETAVINNDGVLYRMVQWVYNTDRPYNLFPSLHTANSIYCYLVFRKILPNFWSWILRFWVILIVMSTVLIKQHYLLDIIGGIVLVYSVYCSFKYYGKRRDFDTLD